MLDIFALVVILVIVALVIWLVITIASIPGNLAKKNNHPASTSDYNVGLVGGINLWYFVDCGASVGANKRSTNKAKTRITY